MKKNLVVSTNCNNRSNKISRRQFMRNSVLGFFGLGAVFTIGRITNASPYKGFLDPYKGLSNLEKPTIPAYNDMALFFGEHQYALVATLAALIIPTDDDPGATEAGVVDYIDKIVAESGKKQALYTNGLKRLDKLAQERYRAEKGFLELSLENQIDLVGFIYDRMHGASNFFQRVFRKLNSIWAELMGVGYKLRFFIEFRKDVISGYYSNPISWKGIGYYGPPQPVGYLDFSDPPSPTYYTGSIRLVNNATCNTCHEKGVHPRGGLIDHTCTTCHRPHSPWPYDETAFHLEDHVGVLFPNPDRKKSGELIE